MSKEKQIEEMAKVLCEDCMRDVAPCRIAKSGRMCDSVWEQAVALYEAGYRKQSEGEWLKFGMWHECSVCHIRKIYSTDFAYCPNCGASMRGDKTNE